MLGGVGCSLFAGGEWVFLRHPLEALAGFMFSILSIPRALGGNKNDPP